MAGFEGRSIAHSVFDNDQAIPMNYIFPPHPLTTLSVIDSEALFPVRRIFCVGRNYAEHAREMGAMDQADGLEPPFFFTKPADALVSGVGELTVTYPPLTSNLHHEIEMVVALSAGGENIAVDQALARVFGYGVGLDLTRRDMQARAKEKGHPWDMSKGFDQSAVCGALMPAARVGHLTQGRIWLKINGEIRQDGDLEQMGWKAADIIANLSTMVRLAAGDLIFSGTPAGVGPLLRGDVLEAGVDRLDSLNVRIV